jgi:transcription-repair coupling factor (superfamily II helicase)
MQAVIRSIFNHALFKKVSNPLHCTYQATQTPNRSNAHLFSPNPQPSAHRSVSLSTFAAIVSNLLHLLEAYRRHPALAQLRQAFKGGESDMRVEVRGLSGAQRCFVLAAFMRDKSPELSKVHLVVAESKEEAAYLQNDLAGILEQVPDAPAVYFFPDSFKRPMFFDDLNPTQVLQRSETVHKITTGEQSGIVVTYPEALFEKVVSPHVLNENRITVTVGEKLDVDFMMEVLIEYGFTRTDFVYEPGQFSIRGGIIDLFSFGNEHPYRIELFDDEVESVRTFDPLTQLSQRRISNVSIVPNLNTRFRQDQKVSLFRILPAGAVLWMQDLQFILDRLQYCFEKAELFASKLTALDSVELREIFRDRAFLYPNDVKEDVEDHPIVYWKPK